MTMDLPTVLGEPEGPNPAEPVLRCVQKRSASERVVFRHRPTNGSFEIQLFIDDGGTPAQPCHHFPWMCLVWLHPSRQSPESRQSKVMATPKQSSKEADMMAIGCHCAVEACHQLDFLPFTCTACGLVTCVEHSRAAAHRCTRTGERDRRIPVCPVCTSRLRMPADGVSLDDHVFSHIDSGCRAHILPAPRRNGCAYPRCKAKHLLIPFTCGECSLDFCTTHRLAQDHLVCHSAVTTKPPTASPAAHTRSIPVH